MAFKDQYPRKRDYIEHKINEIYRAQFNLNTNKIGNLNVFNDETHLPATPSNHVRIAHGTSISNLTAIDKEGLKPGNDVYGKGWGHSSVNAVVGNTSPGFSEIENGNISVIADVPVDVLKQLNYGFDSTSNNVIAAKSIPREYIVGAYSPKYKIPTTGLGFENVPGGFDTITKWGEEYDTLMENESIFPMVEDRPVSTALTPQEIVEKSLKEGKWPSLEEKKILQNHLESLASIDRVDFWKDFAPTDLIPNAGVVSGRNADDIAQVLAGNKPASIIPVTQIGQKEKELLELAEQQGYSVKTLQHPTGIEHKAVGIDKNIQQLQELWKTPFPANQTGILERHRIQGEALGYTPGAIDTFIKAQKHGTANPANPHPISNLSRGINKLKLSPLSSSLALNQFENSIHGLDTEHAGVFNPETGTQHLNFTNNERSLAQIPDMDMSNLIFTHNHPEGTPLSGPDIAQAVQKNFAAIRAVGLDPTTGLPFVSQMERPQGGWKNDALGKLINNEYDKLPTNEEIKKNATFRGARNTKLEELAKILGAKYSNTPLNPSTPISSSGSGGGNVPPIIPPTANINPDSDDENEDDENTVDITSGVPAINPSISGGTIPFGTSGKTSPLGRKRVTTPLPKNQLPNFSPKPVKNAIPIWVNSRSKRVRDFIGRGLSPEDAQIQVDWEDALAEKAARDYAKLQSMPSSVKTQQLPPPSKTSVNTTTNTSTKPPKIHPGVQKYIDRGADPAQAQALWEEEKDNAMRDQAIKMNQQFDAAKNVGTSNTDDDDVNAPLPNTPLFNFLRAVVPMHQRYFLRRVAQGLRGAHALQTNFKANATPLIRGLTSGVSAVGGGIVGYESGGPVAGITGAVGGAVGGAFGPVTGAIGAAIGTVIGILIDKFVQGILNNIRKAYSAGVTFATAITSGLTSVFTHGMGAFDSVATAIISAISAPLGSSGHALQSLATTLNASIVSAITSGLNISSKVLNIAGGLAAAYLTVATTVMGVLIGGLLGPLGEILGALIGSFAGRLFSQLLGVVGVAAGAVLEHLGQALGELGKVAGQAITSVVELLQDVMNTATKFAGEIQQLSAYTGLSMGQAQQTVSSFAAVGVSPSATNSMFNGFDQISPIFKAKASIFGLPGYEDPNFIPALANKFQHSDIWSQRIMMQTMGIENPQMMRLASTDPRLLQQNINFGQTLGKSLGLSPEKIGQLSQQWSLFIDRVSMAIEMIKMKFAGELLPYLATGLSKFTSGIASHASQISSWIKTTTNLLIHGIEWMFVNLPHIIVKGLQFINVAIQAGMQYLAIGLRATANAIAAFRSGGGLQPLAFAIATGLDFILNTFRSFIIGNETVIRLLYDVFDVFETTFLGLGLTVTKTIDTFLNIIRGFVIGLSYLAEKVYDVVSKIPGLSRLVVPPILSYDQASKLPVSNLTNTLINAYAATPFINPVNTISSHIPVSNLAGAVNNIQTSATLRVAQVNIANAASTLENTLTGGAFDQTDAKTGKVTLGTISTVLQDWEKSTDPAKMQKLVDSFGGSVQVFNDAVNKGVKVIVITKDNPDALSKVAAYIAEDVYHTASQE